MPKNKRSSRFVPTPGDIVGCGDTSLLSKGGDGLLRELIWNILSIGIHLEEVARHWAKCLNISGPQWLILMAIDYLDNGHGVSVRDVSAKIHVNSTFVTTETKRLEKAGYAARRPSSQDGRVVLLSLTDKAKRSIAELSVRRKEINDLVFLRLSTAELARLVDHTSLIRSGLDRASRILQLEE
jgi:DNA-binding MarR family transcriptional regulator